MLEELLKEIHAGGTLETRALAARLGTSPQLVEAMLEHLQRIGMIQPYVNCGEGCQGCSLQETCGGRNGNSVRLWHGKSKTDA